MKILNYFLVFLIFMLATAVSNGSQQSIIELQSDTGDWIGGGVDRSLTGSFSLTATQTSINISHPDSGFTFAFVPANGEKFEVKSYMDAQRLPFRGPLNPGMAVSSPGRGCNTISGEFHVFQFDISSQEPRIAMDFVQFCDSQSSALRGQVRINSDVQIPYPLPFAVIIPENRSLIEGHSIQMNGTKSFSMVSEINSYSWTQIEGPSATLENEDQAVVNVILPTGLQLGGEDLKFELTVTDLIGQTDTKAVEIHAASKSDPQSYFWMDSEAGDYIGAGQYWEYDLTNSNITMSRNYDNGVNVSISGEENWTANFAAPDEVQLEEGVYDYAERFPFQSSGVAGLSITGNGRGCNQSYGAFEVLRLTWNDDEPVSFKAKFDQRCEHTTAPLLTGEVAVNAYHESVPTANAGSDFSIFEDQVANLNGSGSYDDEGDALTYQWASEGIDINTPTSSRAYFIAPTLADRQETRIITVELLVSDPEGFMSKDTVNVTVLENNKAPNANDDQAEVNADETIDIYVLDNDLDEDGTLQKNSIVVRQQPSSGLVVITEEGVLKYTPSVTATTQDSMTYTVLDNDGVVSNEANVTIEIIGADDGGTDDGGADDGGADDGGADDGGADDGGADDGGAGDGGADNGGSGGGSTGFLLLLSLLYFAYFRKRV